MVVHYELMKKTKPLEKEEARVDNLRFQAAKSIINTAVRVDDQTMKKRGDANKLAEFMKMVYEEKKRLELEGYVIPS